ncbi:MAG: hypothetical protein M3N32_07815 [Actinomycetota bacterium]|nr:hypothetical protein [Actinomycetota bacterium]
MNPFNKTIEVLREDGWARHTTNAPDGSRCVGGALERAYHLLQTTLRQRCDSYELLCEVSREQWGTGPIAVNAYYAQDVADVIALLEKASVRHNERFG